jgi:hypothetical protein
MGTMIRTNFSCGVALAMLLAVGGPGCSVSPTLPLEYDPAYTDVRSFSDALADAAGRRSAQDEVKQGWTKFNWPTTGFVPNIQPAGERRYYVNHPTVEESVHLSVYRVTMGSESEGPEWTIDQVRRSYATYCEATGGKFKTWRHREVSEGAKIDYTYGSCRHTNRHDRDFVVFDFQTPPHDRVSVYVFEPTQQTVQLMRQRTASSASPTMLEFNATRLLDTCFVSNTRSRCQNPRLVGNAGTG